MQLSSFFAKIVVYKQFANHNPEVTKSPTIFRELGGLNDAWNLYSEEKLSIFAEMMVMKLIQRNIAQIVALCEKHKVESLYVFGSVLTDRFNDESDIDFVVIFDKAKVEDYFDNYFDFKYALEELFNRSVDLVEDQTIKNIYLRQNVDASKQLIYG